MIPLASTEFQFHLPYINCGVFNSEIPLTYLLGPINNICFHTYEKMHSEWQFCHLRVFSHVISTP